MEPHPALTQFLGEFKRVANLVVHVAIGIQELLDIDHPIDLGAGIDEDGILADGNDLTLDLVAYMDARHLLFLVGIEEIGHGCA